MKGQALASLKRLVEIIAPAGFTLNDVVFVRVCLAPSPDGEVDFAGWNEAWKETFGTPATPNKPARTTIAVPEMGRAGTLVGELECICVGPTEPGFSAGSDKLGLPVSNPMLKPYGKIEGRFYSGMGVMPGAALYWTAGVGAPALLPDAPATSLEKYGDLATQTRGVLKKLQENLAGVGFTFQDVVYLHAWIGPDKLRDGKHNLAVWNSTYDEFFNNPQNPHKPARASITTPTFANPGAMLEVEIVAAFPGAPGETVKFDSTSNANFKAYGTPKAMISSGVAVKSGTPLYFSAGTGPKVEGDMKTQALSALDTLKTHLAEAGLGMKDIVFLRAYVVPEADGNVDRKGWSEAYATYFNTPDNPHKPARTTIAVRALPRPFYKIEVEAIAAIP
jgi:enamine deaminase RidA (YjgF/YER057c/UK114 family)